MLTKEEYKKIAATWGMENRIYQSWKRTEEKMPWYEKNLFRYMMGKRVLEIGCNAGLYGYEIAKIAKSYTGIERSYEYYMQAIKTLDFIKSGNACFYNYDVKAMCENQPILGIDYDTIFASFVLYHFTDEEVELFKTQMLPKATTVIIPNRASPRTIERNSHAFWKYSHVIKMLEAAGFKTKILWPLKSRKYYAVLGFRDAA